MEYISYDLSYSFWQFLVATSALASLQRNEGQNETAGSPSRNETLLIVFLNMDMDNTGGKDHDENHAFTLVT